MGATGTDAPGVPFPRSRAFVPRVVFTPPPGLPVSLCSVRCRKLCLCWLWPCVWRQRLPRRRLAPSPKYVPPSFPACVIHHQAWLPACCGALIQSVFVVDVCVSTHLHVCMCVLSVGSAVLCHVRVGARGSRSQALACLSLHVTGPVPIFAHVSLGLSLCVCLYLIFRAACTRPLVFPRSLCQSLMACTSHRKPL